MSCIAGADKDGNRYIACRRGERRPMVDREPLAIVPPASPWQLNVRVHHNRYGPGTITRRNAEAVSVAFDNHPGPDRTFLIAMVGNCMRVLAKEPSHG